jgi:hypothetical protein
MLILFMDHQLSKRALKVGLSSHFRRFLQNARNCVIHHHRTILARGIILFVVFRFDITSLFILNTAVERG